MTAQSKPFPAVGMLVNTFTDWLKHRRELSELRQLNTVEFDRIASELRVSPADLNELVRQGPHAADELPKMLKVLGIDEEALARTQPLVLRDMKRVCALCADKRECDRDLAAGTAAEHYKGYCLNASTIASLDQNRPRADSDSISIVRIPQRLTAVVDAWAEAHDTVRSNAIRQLVELGLSSRPSVDLVDAGGCDPFEIEDD
jgi:transcriptional regulator with XRE-family HTH domain